MMRFPFALRSTVDDLQRRVDWLSSENVYQSRENSRQRSALRLIARGQTVGANATVKRLCKIARDALAGEA